MVFVRKKKINDKEYYYLVKSTRNGNIERYIGLNLPTKKEIAEFKKELDSTKLFLKSKESTLNEIKKEYNDWLNKSSKDQFTKFEEDFAARFTFNTSRIEGSRLSLKDTRLLLSQGITPSNKETRDVNEVENHKKAWDYLRNYKKDIDEKLILKLHAILKEGITEDAGKFRNAGVQVGDMVGLNHKLIKTEISNLIKWHNENKKKINIIELISQFHCIFERIHPFFDGNGRVGRLLMNRTLMINGFPPIIIQNKNKIRYYNALIRGQKGNYLFMVKYLISELVSWRK